MSATLPATVWRLASRGVQGSLDAQPPPQVIRISPCAVSWLVSWCFGPGQSKHTRSFIPACGRLEIGSAVSSRESDGCE